MTGLVDASGERGGRRYVYAIVPAGTAGLGGMRGLDGCPVMEVRQGPVTALVSMVDSDRVRPSRANLSAHQQVVASAHRTGPVLPVRFGTVFPDEDTLRSDLLGPEELRLDGMLSDFRGKDEFRLRCRYLPDVAIREVVESSPGIGKLRARAEAATSAAARQAHQMRLGEVVMVELERRRERDADAVLAVLAPHILAWDPVEDSSDDVPLHAAILVDRPRIPQMEEAIEGFAARQKDRLQLELIGPLPLWDFSHVSAGVA